LVAGKNFRFSASDVMPYQPGAIRAWAETSEILYVAHGTPVGMNDQFSEHSDKVLCNATHPRVDPEISSWSRVTRAFVELVHLFAKTTKNRFLGPQIWQENFLCVAR
jgi:hypothetical protein